MWGSLHVWIFIKDLLCGSKAWGIRTTIQLYTGRLWHPDVDLLQWRPGGGLEGWETSVFVEHTANSCEKLSWEDRSVNGIVRVGAGHNWDVGRLCESVYACMDAIRSWLQIILLCSEGILFWNLGLNIEKKIKNWVKLFGFDTWGTFSLPHMRDRFLLQKMKIPIIQHVIFEDLKVQAGVECGGGNGDCEASSAVDLVR